MDFFKKHEISRHSRTFNERDFNSRIPLYNDDSDYTTNAPSYYDDLARKNQLLKTLSSRIWEYQEVINKQFNEWDQEIRQRFLEWDKNLEEFDDEVLRLLQEWLEDGTLDHIINDVIFNELNGRIDNIDDSIINIKDSINDLGVSVKTFGAVGDGVTDDYPAIKQTIDFVGNMGGGVVYFPPGHVYLINQPIKQTYDNVYLKGSGRSSIIKPSKELQISETESEWAIQIISDSNETPQQIMQTNTPGSNQRARKGHVWIGVQDAAVYKKGELVYLQGDFATSPWHIQNRGYLTKGETNLIIDVNTENNQIRLSKPISDTWENSEMVFITSIKPLNNVGIENIGVYGNDDDRYYRGIEIVNTVGGVVKDCHTKYCGIMGINSRRSFKNKIINPYVVESWIGDISQSDRATLGLCYGVRLTEDSLSKISDGTVLNARHTIDISGNFPSRQCIVEGMTTTQLNGEVGNIATHSTAEGCIFRDNTAVNGSYGFLNVGLNNEFYDNRTVGTSVSLYDLGYNTIFKDNNVDGHLRLGTPENNTTEISTTIKDNTINAFTIAYIVQIDDRPYDKLFNFNITGNKLLLKSAETQGILNLDYSGVPTVTFNNTVSLINNIGKTSIGVEYNLFINKDTSLFSFPRFTVIKSDTEIRVRTPKDPIPGHTMFHKDHNKFAIFNGENWVDALGEILPDDTEG